ncbi:hypothetical protein CRENBAI_013248 [Crenichthys baileyi]|uniref:Uncharacterized protein n=1 Tax=Crenichthys baileyi TaxID=28760 RepID=A0AAV9RS01_9TELE
MIMILANMKTGIDKEANRDKDEEACREKEQENKTPEEEHKVKGVVKEMQTDREEEEEEEEVEIQVEVLKGRDSKEAEMNS